MLHIALLATAGAIGIIYIFAYYISLLRKYKDVNKLPGPSAWEVIRLTFAGGSNYDKYAFSASLNKKYGPIVKLWIKPFKPVIMVAHTDIFDKILLSRDHLIKTKMYDLLKPYIGEGIATISKIDQWRKDRKICNPAFHHGTITGYLPLFTKHTDKFLELIKSQTGKVIDSQPLIHLFTLDIVFEALLNQEQNFQENKNPEYLNARVDYFGILTERLYSVFLTNETLFNYSKYFERMETSLKVLRKFTNKIIQTEKAKRINGTTEAAKLHLIDVLFANKIEGKALDDQINTFILAGHDTIAQGMCFALYELAKHPDLQQRLYEEITSIVGKDKNCEITYRDLQEMKFCESVVKEALRIHTVVPIIERFTGEDIVVDGITYPKDTQIMLNIGAIHKSERYYKNADKFDPDRFMPENVHMIQRNSYAPFSLGPRDCIGKQYAMLQITFFIAKLLQKFVVEPVVNHELKVLNEIIVKSINGIPVIFKERL